MGLIVETETITQSEVLRAPNIETIRKEKRMTKKTTVKRQKIPTLSIAACGGCGINIVNATLEKVGDLKGEDNLKVLFMDTSESNLKGTQHRKNTDCFLIEQGFTGSGKIRANNFAPIKDAVTKMITDLSYKVCDINIVVFSLSGGTGSVIGPVLIRKLLDLGKKVICLTVLAEDSRADCINSVNTIKSVYNIVKGKYYLPFAIFDNDYKKGGRAEVDKRLVAVILNTAAVFLSDASEVDFEDKMTFCSPNKLLKDIPLGVHLFSTDTSESEDSLCEIKPEQEETSIDAIFEISRAVDQSKDSIEVGVRFNGYDPLMEQESIELTMQSSGIPQELYNHLHEKSIQVVATGAIDLNFQNNDNEEAYDDEIVL